MESRIKSFLSRSWTQEILMFLFVLSLHLSKNDWVNFSSWAAVIGALGYFMIIYSHAQINRFFLLPTLLKQHRPFVYLGMSLVLMLVFAVVCHEYSELVLSRFRDFTYSHQRGITYQVASVIGLSIVVIGPAIMLQLYREQRRQQNEQLLFNELQLQSLRTQLNPHFLFNTFNTLYGTSLQHPERTPDLIMKVSQLLRYQIESDSRQWVTLEEELEFINSYIQLEKERVGYRCHITFEQCIPKPDTFKIPPMLLIVFVENAFKHGTGTVENCFVALTMDVVDGQLHAQIKNSIPQKKPNVVSTKIGLKKTRERLDLLHGENYRLEIDAQPDSHTVRLQLPLKQIASCHPCNVA